MNSAITTASTSRSPSRTASPSIEPPVVNRSTGGTARAIRLAFASAMVCLGLLWSSEAKAQGTNVPWIPIQFLTAAGLPCSGCTLDTWAAGTTTAQATFSDSTLSTQNANPVVMNTAGRPTSGGLFLSATSYRFRLRTSAAATIWDLDNITAIPTTSGNTDISGTAGEAIALGQVVYLSDGSGSLTAGRWYLADADNTYSSTTSPLVGIATAAIASAASGTIRIAGRSTGLSGLTAGESYYISATAGALAAAPPTNARFIGGADTTSTLTLGAGTGSVRLPDSDGTHAAIVRTSSNLTADRLLTIVTGDAAQTVTLSRPKAPGGRCTLTSGTAVTTSDVTAATTVYYTPYEGAENPSEIWLYDGSAAWTALTLSEISIAVPATTATIYDVFIYNNAGTATLELTAWTNDTTRATALVQQNEVWVRTGATTRLYVCSFRTTTVAGQTEDSLALRYLWNYYNRVPRPMRGVIEDTDTWTYTTATLRQARAAPGNQLAFVIGVSEDPVHASVLCGVASDTANVTVTVGIGLDSTSANATGTRMGLSETPAANIIIALTADWTGFPGVGWHTLVWLEYSGAVGTTTWQGDGGIPLLGQSGISGWLQG